MSEAIEAEGTVVTRVVAVGFLFLSNAVFRAL